uniref:Uncharacterized protein n=2 Tax=Tetraselmis sp. GSL018 TaxID=582737 RepID=A0A061S060_9CHLO|mmetsp:Transcript_26658/g.63177  ORF Transcript_26658/g.63177 Transcript_26658/m.63177 type:complete len:378 (+) Transcript_26658:161-1294(+)|eukprot:CAMPEP_0177611504 /NCGR_PEP_ID=MMETSP0419_2-20121207/20536_1 /TAXON_ID=582737 /ORGANISM="Tetraselmis sp., Strain GSL018" /LENGTH=377 /DNA_ID=CAMNT_0019107257 /DNA_START=100 /DNA_END=1233 /DNA_ORIENTATION=-
MREKRPLVYRQELDNLNSSSEELRARSERQISGDAFYGDALLPPPQRQPAPTLSVFPCWQTELYTEGAELEFEDKEGRDLLELWDQCRGGKLTVAVNSPAVQPGTNSFIPDENKLLLDARAMNMSFEEISAMIPLRSVSALRRQYKHLKSTGEFQSAAVAAAPAAAEPSAPEPPPAALRRAAVVTHIVERKGGDGRITLRGFLPTPPRGFTGMEAHNLKSLAGVTFYESAVVPDPDDPAREFVFSIKEPEHCACFNIGVGEDGSPLISWSDLHAIYMLPDGTKWAEHGYFYDLDDLKGLSKKVGKPWEGLLGGRRLKPQELVKNKHRYHTRLINIEYECWIYKDCIPEIWNIDGDVSPDAYFWTLCFDPDTMREVQS